jgi:putative serine/threonine protein kinase
LEGVVPLAIETLKDEPYASIICYPKSDRAELRKRLKELQKIQVKAVEFSGKKQVLNLPVLGKGCVGIVAKAYWKNKAVAMKIRRIDADRSMMRHEAEMLRKANSVQVGPQFLAVSRDFLLMQFVDGSLLPEWLEKRRRKMRLRKVLRDILEQCCRLDNAHVDHGELSHAPKHIIVDEKEMPFIVDFETASTNRRSSNTTSICQFLFLNSETARKIAEQLGQNDKKAIIEALRQYKRKMSRENFEKILKVCGLQTT